MYSADHSTLRLLRVQINRREKAMPYASDEKHPPRNCPTLYRRASLSDITDPRILGFYKHGGEYFRKNGAPRKDGSFPVVDVLRGANQTWTVTGWNYTGYFVRLDEILTEEDAPPKHFKLTRITVDVGDSEGLNKFAYLLGARGYLQPEYYSDEEHTYEMKLDLLEPILVPPTMLLNLFDDCITTQERWGEEQDE